MMRKADEDFARRSVRYLRSHGLRPAEIESTLRDELECPPPVARQLASAA